VRGPGEGSGLGVFEVGAVKPAEIGRPARRRSITCQFCFGAVPYTVHEARLQGHYRSHRGSRPLRRPTSDESGRCDHAHVPQARLYLCANPACRDQVLICSDCDRGHIYCAECAPRARRRSLHRAGRRYQASSRGRIKHAERSRRYRARKNRSRENKVTHHGSLADQTNALLSEDPVEVVEQPLPGNSRQPLRRQEWCCMRCGRRCSVYVRQGFLPRRVRRNRQRGSDHDHPR